jgi:hypothetical protein
VVDECRLRKDFITCFFYCHDGDPTSNSAVGILKGLVDQLLTQFPQMLPPCHTRRTSSGEPTLRSSTITKKLFEDFCETIPKLFIIIDGLDECEKDERRHVLDVLTEVVGLCDTKEPGKLRLLLVSQDYVDIRNGLHSSAISRRAPRILQISDIDNEGDIRAYTRVWVERISSRFSPFTEEMSEYLRNLTVANAKGTAAAAQSIVSSPLTTRRNVFICQTGFAQPSCVAHPRRFDRCHK